MEAMAACLTPHSSDDDDRVYKTREALAEEKKHDCVLGFRQHLEEVGVLAPGAAEEMRAEIMREVDRALQEAEAAPLPSPEPALPHADGGCCRCQPRRTRSRAPRVRATRCV